MTRRPNTDRYQSADGCRIEYQIRGTDAVAWRELQPGELLPPAAITQRSHVFLPKMHRLYTGPHCTACGAALPWAEDEV